MKFSNPSGTVEGFHGERITILRIRGKAYTSDDANLHPEIVRIFQYIRRHGVTAELMEYFGKL